MVGKTVETVGEDKTIWKGPILINPLVLLVGGKPKTKPPSFSATTTSRTTTTIATKKAIMLINPLVLFVSG